MDPDRPRTNVPHLDELDSTMSLLREGYTFVQSRCRQLESDVFVGRLTGKKAIFVTGPLATELFYDEKRLQRAGALPWTVKMTLFGKGGVQELDDEAHRERKALFMSILSRPQIERLLEFTERAWLTAVREWPHRQEVPLFDEAAHVLCRAVCTWAGIQLSKDEHVRLTRDCVSMVDGFASVGVRFLRARTARKRSERWARGIIDSVRNGQSTAPLGSPARKLAEYRSTAGDRLPPEVAAVELLNLIRPTVAIAWWVSFLGLSLHTHPEYTRWLREEPSFAEPYVQEVRRVYPFTPYLGAKVRSPFEWSGVRFRKGELVILDVYGMLHDPRWWDKPEDFKPERFLERDISAFDYIPNGGGDTTQGHRCAGEMWVKKCLEQALHVLVNEISYEVPPQPLDYDLSRIPTRPRSGLILKNVHLVNAGTHTSQAVRLVPSLQV